MENEQLTEEFRLLLGRINGIHAGLLSMARCLPPEVAARAAVEVLQSAEAVHAGALATPISDSTVHEMQRVQLELATVLQAAAQDR